MSATAYKAYLSYSPNAEPHHPGRPWTRFVCISDTHSRTNVSVPPGDVLIHAGDLSSWGMLANLRPTLDWLRSLPHEVKIIVAGNHDLCLDRNWKNGSGSGGLRPEEVDAAQRLIRSRTMRDSGIIYLERESAEIAISNGTRWKVYGSPAAPFHIQGAFQYVTDAEAIKEWLQIPIDVEILVTHTPPFGILDRTRRGILAGCRALSSRIDALPRCRLHVFGHIHEAHGVDVKKRTVIGENNEIQQMDNISANGAIYHGTQPVIVDLLKMET